MPCVDYKAGGDLAKAIKDACPNGVDVYFDNVGGTITDAVFVNLNFSPASRCGGSISGYNAAAPEMGPRLFMIFVGRRVNMRGFIVSDFIQHWPGAMKQMGAWVPVRPGEISRGYRAGHRECAARLHRPPARRELRQTAGAAGA